MEEKMGFAGSTMASRNDGMTGNPGQCLAMRPVAVPKLSLPNGK